MSVNSAPMVAVNACDVAVALLSSATNVWAMLRESNTGVSAGISRGASVASGGNGVGLISGVSVIIITIAPTVAVESDDESAESPVLPANKIPMTIKTAMKVSANPPITQFLELGLGCVENGILLGVYARLLMGIAPVCDGRTGNKNMPVGCPRRFSIADSNACANAVHD